MKYLFVGYWNLGDVFRSFPISHRPKPKWDVQGDHRRAGGFLADFVLKIQTKRDKSQARLDYLSNDSRDL